VRPGACRVVTSSISARLLIAGQLAALTEYDWTVVSGDEWDGPPPTLTHEHVRMRRELHPSDPAAFVRLLRFFRRHRFAFVQTHTPKASLLALPAARLAGLPTIYTMHGCLYFADNSRAANVVGWLFERWCCSWAHVVVTQSREDAEVVPRARIAPARKVRYVGNGIDVERYRAPVKEVGEAGAPPVVLMVSRLVVEKGCEEYFGVAERLAGRARFVHVGMADADQRDSISAERIAEVTRTACVEFRGEAADVRPHIAEADMVVQPSFREGIPRAVMEAAAGGRPVVAYDVRGVREVIPADTGLLVARGETELLVDRVEALLGDEAERVRLARRLQSWVVDQFSEAVVIERLRAVYGRVAG
jgi:glycosyltransferase involved in cell wall biosynthesis